MAVLTPGVLVFTRITLVRLLTGTLQLLRHLEKLLRFALLGGRCIVGHQCKKCKESKCLYTFDLNQIKIYPGEIELWTNFDLNQIDLNQIKIHFLRTK